MPDITMCMQHDCNVKQRCKRYIAERTWQAVFNKNMRPAEKGCDYFMPLYAKKRG